MKVLPARICIARPQSYQPQDDSSLKLVEACFMISLASDFDLEAASKQPIEQYIAVLLSRI